MTVSAAVSARVRRVLRRDSAVGLSGPFVCQWQPARGSPCAGLSTCGGGMQQLHTALPGPPHDRTRPVAPPQLSALGRDNRLHFLVFRGLLATPYALNLCVSVPYPFR